MPDLMTTLQALEVELHHPGVRCCAQRLVQLLHPDFHEVGRSGRAYDRPTIVAYLAAQTHSPDVVPDHFSVSPLAPGVALLNYRSAHRQADGSLFMHTLRSSLWLDTGAGWQLRYHQGTPAEQPW
jgi:hypothetical protein